MPTVTLKPGTFTQISGGDAVGSFVGSGAILGDGSDSTYEETTAKVGRSSWTGRATMDTLTLPTGATVTSVVAHVRAQAMSGTATPAQLFTNLRLASNTTEIIQFGASFADGGWWNPPTGSIADLSADLTDSLLAEYDSGITQADLLAMLEAGAVVDIAPFAVSSSLAVEVRVYEFSIDITYSEPLELPCDTDVALDLSTAVFRTDEEFQYGQYVDGVITGKDAFSPEFWFTSFALDPLKPYRVTVDYDSSSPHDDGGRLVFLYAAEPGDEPAASAELDDGSTVAGGTVTVRIGPGVADWDDPTSGVAQGFTRLYFQTSENGAVSAITIRKLCTFAVPPLRLINRGGDQFSSAWAAVGHQRTRQGGNRQLGIL